jgi:hypothetical protein
MPSRLPDFFSAREGHREVTLPPQSEPNSAAFLSQIEISAIRNESEKFFITHVNLLVNGMIEVLLTNQNQSSEAASNSGGQMKILAIQYCGIVQRAVGDLAGRLGRAIGERQGLGNQASEWILNLTGIFAAEKTSAREVSVLFQYLKNRFAMPDEKHALRVLQLSVALLAHRGTQILGEPDEGVEARKELLESLERLGTGNKLASRKRRVLLRRTYDIQSSAREKFNISRRGMEPVKSGLSGQSHVRSQAGLPSRKGPRRKFR